MNGIINLYIDKNKNVYKALMPKNSSSFKAFPKLANEEVLFIEAIYSIENRKPNEIYRITFHRITLDNFGVYTLELEHQHKDLYNFINLSPTTAEALAKADSLVHRPKAPASPSSEEKSALYKYINTKYPTISDMFPYTVEYYIKHWNEQYNEYKLLVKNASIIGSNIQPK